MGEWAKRREASFLNVKRVDEKLWSKRYLSTKKATCSGMTFAAITTKNEAEDL